LINFIFKYIVLYNVTLLGIDSITKETNVLKVTFFVVSFFNNCMLIVLIGANFEFTDAMFNGKYSDFNKHWFISNGRIIVSNMIA